MTIKNSASKLGPGVDVRGDGGMVIAPPSVKPGKGTYRWLHNKPIADAPSWLVQLILEKQQRASSSSSGTSEYHDKESPSPAAHWELERACRAVAKEVEGARNDTLNREAFKLGQLIGGGTLYEGTVRQRLTEAAQTAGLGDEEIKRTLDGGLAAGIKEPRQPGTILDPANPMRSARELVAANFTDGSGRRMLHRYRGAFWLWNGSYYQLVDDETIISIIWIFLDSCLRRRENGLAPYKPTRTLVDGTLAALKAVTALDKKIEPPAWLAEDNALPIPAEIFACGNGLLHLPTKNIYLPTPNFFALNSSEVNFDSAASTPVLWLAFLEQLFGDDQEAQNALQEWFGYTLVSDTSQQKIFIIVGPTRSGKGTIARVIAGLLGRDIVAGPTISSLAEQFGLEPLITKRLAIVSDARIGARTDKSAIVERLLSISGEDHMTVARKFRDAWHGRLPVKFMVITNELPSMNDGSGALAGRFVALVLSNSFFGKEDLTLTSKLLTELPGILNWSIEGYHRLRARGHFVQPKSAQNAIDTIEILGAPVKAFIRDCCDVGPQLTVTVDALWSTWRNWCHTEGRKDAGTKEWFGRNLRSAELAITSRRPGTGDEREREYVGIGLKPGAEESAAARAEAERNKAPF